MRIRQSIVVLILALAALPALAQQDLPYGWHKPRKAELGKRGSKNLALKADFDGDGKPDTALILADDRGRAVGVFAFATSTSRWFKLDSEAVVGLQHWRIKLLPPGAYGTICPHDDTACKPAMLRLGRPAIDSFLEGKSSTLFYWDSDTKKFNQATVGASF